jgi:putative transposase
LATGPRDQAESHEGFKQRSTTGSAWGRAGLFTPKLPICGFLVTYSATTTTRKSFLRKWRLKCCVVAYSLEEAGDQLFTVAARLPDSQWRSARTTNAIERLHEEIKRRIKTQTVLPSAETAAMLFWALLAAGQITMRKVDGCRTLAEKPTVQCIDLAA